MDSKTDEVHSGHFMVSILEDSEDETVDSSDVTTESVAMPSIKDNQPTSKDKNRLIFENLASLFKYLDIAYSGKLTSPKWDKFRGLRFAIKNKIRLNNIIWREYHMQYVKKLKPVVVQFQTPMCEDHSKTEAVVLEGKYWKRRVSTLCKEYSLWRVSAKNRICSSQNRQIIQCASELLEGSDLCPYQLNDLSKNASSKLMEEIMMDIDVNLDLFFDQPITFPHPRDLPTFGNADIMQPGLQQLQPDRSSYSCMTCNIFQSSQPSLTSQYVSPDVYPCEHIWSTSDFPSNKYIPGAIHSTMPLSEAEQSCSLLPAEHFSTIIPSSKPFSSFLPNDAKSSLSELVTISDESCGFGLSENVSETDQHGPHPYQSSLLVSHEHCFPHQLKVASQQECSSHSTSIQSKYELNRNLTDTKGYLVEPMQSFGYCAESSGENNDHINKSTLLNALLRGGNVNQNSNSLDDHMDVGAVQKAVNTSPLLCNALNNSENYLNTLPNKHLIRSKCISNNPIQMKNDLAHLTNPEDLSGSYTHSSYLYCDQSSITSINTAQGIRISRVSSIDTKDNVSVPVGNYKVSRNCSGSQNEEPGSSVLGPTVSSRIQPVVSRADASSLPVSHNRLIKNCKTESFNFGVTDLLIHNSNNKNIQNLDPSCSTIKSVQGNPSYLVNVENVASQNPHTSILVFKEDNGLPTPIQRNLSISANTDFTFSSHTSDPCTVPGNSTSKSNIFSLAGTELVHASTEESNSELETLVPGSWTEPQSFPHTIDITLNDMDQSLKPAVTSEKQLNVSKLIESNPSLRGRSNSAGNLFSLQHNQIPGFSIQGSEATNSSYGSTEILSPMLSNHKGFLCATSPPCSPPSFSEQNDQQATKQVLGNSSEERRRQSMQSGLQTLRQLLKLHSNVDNLASSNRLAARRNGSNLDVTSISGAYSLGGDADIPSEMLNVGLRPSNGFDLVSDEQMMSSGNEITGTGRASKAATLRNAAELIRKLRDERNLLETQCKNLKEEVKALQSAINHFCEKLPPNSSSTRPISDQSFTSYYSEWFRSYVHKQTEANWKFYIFSLIIGGIFKSYCNTTISSSRDQFIRSVYGWLDANCSLVQLRPAVMQALCTLGKTTSVLQEPSKLPEQSRSSSIANLF
ncbi:MLX-interacting protein isoform 1 [Schistosoma japonicum]|uniref:MLX-interacting protein isoform 1 n=2 Tax=Schistosoma japonicum TaxID=6182 RepID=A0A4Z2DLX9_SCHJA|nr:MLX-interacting protein isoform 1 [Schistosoma japonicum]